MEDNNNKGGNGFVGILCLALVISLLGNIWLYMNQHSFTSQISKLEAKNEDYQSKYDQLSEENKQLKANVQALEDQIATLNTQLEALNSSESEPSEESTASISESADLSPELQEKLNETDKISGSSGSSSSSGSTAYEHGRELANQASDYLESIDWDELQDEAEKKGEQFASFLNGFLR